MMDLKAEYYGHYGSDNMVVDMARVSFDKTHDKYTDEQNHNLIRFLAYGYTNHEWNEKISEIADCDDFMKVEKLVKAMMRTSTHWAPFAHPKITMRETVPIFVARQRFKHYVGFEYNEISRRYVKDDPDFFSVKEWRAKPSGSIKQGSGDTHSDNHILIDIHDEHCQRSQDIYNGLISRGVAPEMARMELPQSMMTSYYVTGSLAAWARAYNQRIDGHAQKEIQDLAKQWHDIIEPLFPESWKALTK